MSYRVKSHPPVNAAARVAERTRHANLVFLRRDAMETAPRMAENRSPPQSLMSDQILSGLGGMSSPTFSSRRSRMFGQRRGSTGSLIVFPTRSSLDRRVRL